jgi:hypothetical protein
MLTIGSSRRRQVQPLMRCGSTSAKDLLHPRRKAGPATGCTIRMQSSACASSTRRSSAASAGRDSGVASRAGSAIRVLQRRKTEGRREKTSVGCKNQGNESDIRCAGRPHTRLWCEREARFRVFHPRGTRARTGNVMKIEYFHAAGCKSCSDAREQLLLGSLTREQLCKALLRR